MKKQPAQTDLIPPAPAEGVEHVFYANEARKIKLYAKRVWHGLAVKGSQVDGKSSLGDRTRFALYRSTFPQPGQENIVFISDFREWDAAYRAGERAARFEEGRDVDAGYSAAFGPHKETKKRASQ